MKNSLDLMALRKVRAWLASDVTEKKSLNFLCLLYAKAMTVDAYEPRYHSLVYSRASKDMSAILVANGISATGSHFSHVLDDAGLTVTGKEAELMQTAMRLFVVDALIRGNVNRVAFSA